MQKVEKYLHSKHYDLWSQLFIKDLIPHAILALEQYAELYHEDKVKNVALPQVSKRDGVECRDLLFNFNTLLAGCQDVLPSHIKVAWNELLQKLNNNC